MQLVKQILVLALMLTIQACVAVNPQPSQNEKASAVNVQLGIGYLQQNNMDLANEKLSKALRQDPDSAPAHNAFAILQERLLQKEKAEYHYKQAIKLDSGDSQAANNYGAFLCRNNRELESEKYFLKALDNPLYKTPEFAYTNAALCLLKVNRNEVAMEYLHKAVAAKSDFPVALFALSEIYFDAGEHKTAKLYLDRFHLVAKPTSRSLWLAIRNELQMNSQSNVDELSQRLATDYPNSDEYQSWLKIQ